VAIAAVAVIAVGGLMLLPRSGTDIGAPPVATPTPVPAPTPVAYSLPPGWIVFERFRQAPDGSTTTMDYDRRQIWLVKADGSGLHELAPGLPVDGKVAPDISPDGTKVVFSSWTPKSQIWEAGIEGGDPRLVSTDCSGLPTECQEWDPAYSPDGRRIAFVHSTDGLKTSAIAIRDLATGEVTRLPTTSVPESDGWVAQPTWSPDGLQVAYHRNTQKPGDNFPSDTRIWIVNADGTGLYRLATPADYKAADPDWSPDGSRIVFATEGAREQEGGRAVRRPGAEVRPGGQQHAIYTIRPDGTDALVVMEAGDRGGGGASPPLAASQLAPTWMPDGKHILYYTNGTWNLVEPDGSNAAPVNPEKLTFSGYPNFYGFVATWQPTP
jgi:Tol biopolymer transport system component